MAKRNSVLHYRTSGTTAPTAENLKVGEIAMSYAASGETLYIKNTENEVASFPARFKTINGEAVTGNGNIALYRHWYGSQAEYDKETKGGTEKEPYTIYHILLQPDWNEQDTTSLAYIKNKPQLLQTNVSGETLNLFYE